MIKLLGIVTMILLVSCQEGGKSPGQRLDSVLSRTDTIAKRIEDSTRSKARQILHNADNALAKKDTTHKDTSRHK